MKPTPAVTRALTSSYQKMIPFHNSMTLYFPLPKSLSLSWRQLPNQNVQPFFVTAREMIPHRQTRIAMGWPQPKTPIQTDTSTAIGVSNKTIVPHRAKMMDMRFWWLQCHASQDQFRYYWDAGSKNWEDYHTKYHPDA